MEMIDQIPFFKPGEFPKKIRVFRDREGAFVDAKVKIIERAGLIFIHVPGDDVVSYSMHEGGLGKTTLGCGSVYMRRRSEW